MPPSPKQQFVEWCVAQLGRPVLMSAKGDFYVAAGKRTKLAETFYDCSGLVTCGVKAVAGKDFRDSHSAQKLWAEAEPFLLVAQTPGDFGFYGSDPDHVEHVVVATAGGIISADGATSSIKTPEGAKANPVCRVRFHSSIDYRHDVPFLGWRSNIYAPTT